MVYPSPEPAASETASVTASLAASLTASVSSSVSASVSAAVVAAVVSSAESDEQAVRDRAMTPARTTGKIFFIIASFNHTLESADVPVLFVRTYYHSVFLYSTSIFTNLHGEFLCILYI